MPQVTHVSAFSFVGMAGFSLAFVLGIFSICKSQSRAAELQEELGRKDAEISSLLRSADATQVDAQAKEDELVVLRGEKGSLNAQLQGLRGELEIVRTHNQALGDQVKRQISEAQLLKDESHRIQVRHTQTLELLEARTSELKGAQTFLTKADHLSGAEVIGLVEALNSEILQTAALVAESLKFKEKRKMEKEEEQMEELKEVYISATEILGPRMVELLKSSDHHEDPILLQLAFQAGMSAYSNWIISTWYFEDPEDEHLLREIYARVQESEEQAVSGRWRALTRIHAQHMTDNEPDLAMYFVDAFVNILLTAGVDENKSTLHETIVGRFAERISIIVKGAQRLNKAVGEEITSCDFAPLYIEHDVPFDPSRMDDTFGSSGENETETQEPILCTTEFGLIRAVKQPIGKWQEAVLLRPKVVLQSCLDAITADEIQP